MKRLLMLSTLALVAAACNTQTAPTGLASGVWKVAPLSSAQVASVTNGPWTLAQSSTTLAAPLAGYCDSSGKLAVNTAKNLMQPYYFPVISGTDNALEGYFDYRVKDHDEALVHGSSSDGGLTWSMDATKLRLNAGLCPVEGKPVGNDAGQGHAVLLKVGGKTLLYTLNREASQVDSAGLLIHDITTGVSSLKDSEPVTTAKPVPDGIQTTLGLKNPDGILGAVPGTGGSSASPLKVLYLAKFKGSKATPAMGLDAAKLCQDSQSQALTSKKANYDRTEMRLASTTDGLTFTDLGAVTGLNNPDDNASSGFRYVGPRGTVLQYSDGKYGLFFSGGNCSDGDSDAYHFLGYAESKDLLSWTVLQGASNPLVQVDYSYPSAKPAAYASGRVYAPNVILNTDGSAKLIFSGYQTGKPLPDQNADIGSPVKQFVPTDSANYRTIVILKLTR